MTKKANVLFYKRKKYDGEYLPELRYKAVSRDGLKGHPYAEYDRQCFREDFRWYDYYPKCSGGYGPDARVDMVRIIEGIEKTMVDPILMPMEFFT